MVNIPVLIFATCELTSSIQFQYFLPIRWLPLYSSNICYLWVDQLNTIPIFASCELTSSIQFQYLLPVSWPAQYSSNIFYLWVNQPNIVPIFSTCELTSSIDQFQWTISSLVQAAIASRLCLTSSSPLISSLYAVGVAPPSVSCTTGSY